MGPAGAPRAPAVRVWGALQGAPVSEKPKSMRYNSGWVVGPNRLLASSQVDALRVQKHQKYAL